MKEDKTYHPASHLQLHTSVYDHNQTRRVNVHVRNSFIYKSKNFIKNLAMMNGKKSKSINNVYLQNQISSDLQESIINNITRK